MRIRLSPPDLIGRATLVIVIVALLQVAASLLFYEQIDRQSIREDHARRVAELLVVSHRVEASGLIDTARLMTTAHLDATIDAAPAIIIGSGVPEAQAIRRQIHLWEPELAAHPLALDIEKVRGGKEHLVGSMQLADGRWLNFRSHDFSAGWPIALRATAMTVAITLISLIAGVYVLHLLGAPLRRLTGAVRRIGEGKRVEIVERGPADLRNLGRAFNEMQQRIALLVSDQAKALEAIGHDLRTPLSRLTLAAGYVEPEDIRAIVTDSTVEMEDMLSSVIGFLQAQHLESAPERIDLVATLRDLLAPFPAAVFQDSPAQADILTYREPLVRALRPLIENAVQYGDTVEARLLPDGDHWTIHILDRGPGIPENCMEQIFDPFFRVDEARARDTPGFGLGIPTAHRLLQRFGGDLRFRNDPDGGLHAIVTVPQAQPA